MVLHTLWTVLIHKHLMAFDDTTGEFTSTMSARVRNFTGLFSYSYFFLLTPMCWVVSANPVYRLTFRVSEQRFSGTLMSVKVRLYHNDTSSILKLLNGNKTPFLRNTTHTFPLLPSDTKDIGPICLVDLQLCSLYWNKTQKVCGELNGSKKLILKKFTVTYISEDDVGIFIPNSSKKTDVGIGQRSKQFVRAGTQWGPWGDCSCETFKRPRQRFVPSCRGFAERHETGSEYCESIFKICSTQWGPWDDCSFETSKRTRRRFVPSFGGVIERPETESEQCVSIFKIYERQMTYIYIIIAIVVGSVVLVSIATTCIFGVKKCCKSSPTTHIQMSPNNEGPVVSLGPELGSTLTLDVIRPCDKDVSPVPTPRMQVPNSRPELNLLEQGDFFDPRSYPSSTSVESYDYEGID